MSDRELSPLDADLRTLFDAERGRPDPPDSMKRRVYAAVLGASVAAAPAAAAASTARGLVARLVTHPVSWLLTAATVGTFAFVAARGPGGNEAPPTSVSPRAVVPEVRIEPAATSVRPPPPQDKVPAVVAPPAPVSGRAARPARPGASPAPSTVVPEPAPSGEASRESPVLSTLAVERTILERTRRALVGGRPSEAIRIAAMHERRYPTGQLAEERESLRIQALLALGDRAQARERAMEFRRRFPRSIFLPAIDAALGSR